MNIHYELDKIQILGYPIEIIWGESIEIQNCDNKIDENSDVEDIEEISNTMDNNIFYAFEHCLYATILDFWEWYYKRYPEELKPSPCYDGFVK